MALPHEAADGVADLPVPVSLVVDLPPLRQQDACLGVGIFAPGARIERVGAELGEHHRQVELLLDHVEELARRRAAIDVGAEDIEPLTVLRDQIDVVGVAVDQRHRVVGIALLDQRDGLAHERIEVCRARIVGACGQIADLERGPGKPIVVLVTEHPQEHAVDAAVMIDRRLELPENGAAVRRRRVIDVGHEGAVDVDAVAPHERVEHGANAVILVNPFDPARRNVVELANGVDAHVLE